MRVVDLPSCKGSKIHDYVWKHFGPESTKKDQTWWVQNCGIWGAPDTFIQGEQLCLGTDPKEKIIKLLQ